METNKIILTVVCSIMLVFAAVSTYVTYKTSQDKQYVTIASWYIEGFDADKARDKKFIDYVAKTLSKYDVVAIQGIDNVNESIDVIDHKPSCDRNANASQSEDYHLIENTLESALPENYRVLISQQTGDERFAMVFNKDKVMALAQGVIMPNASQTSQYCEVNANDSSMKRSPFLVPFRANNYTFAVMTANIDLENSVEEMNVLQYNYGFIAEFYQWNFGDVFLVGNNVVVTDEMRFNDSRYYKDVNFITLKEITDESDFSYEIYDDISILKVKMKED